MSEVGRCLVGKCLVGKCLVGKRPGIAPAPPPPAQTETAQSSQSSTAAAAATNYETPRSRSNYGPPQTGFSRNLLPIIETLDSVTSPRYFVSGAAARLDLGATTRLTHNYRVIKEGDTVDKEIVTDKTIDQDWEVNTEVNATNE